MTNLCKCEDNNNNDNNNKDRGNDNDDDDHNEKSGHSKSSHGIRQEPQQPHQPHQQQQQSQVLLQVNDGDEFIMGKLDLLGSPLYFSAYFLGKFKIK